MNDVKFKLDQAAFRSEVLQSSEMLNLTKEYAAKQGGKDTHMKPFIGYDRAKTIVYPNTKRNPG